MAVLMIRACGPYVSDGTCVCVHTRVCMRVSAYICVHMRVCHGLNMVLGGRDMMPTDPKILAALGQEEGRRGR